SNHGWGLAIDFNVANKRSTKDDSRGVRAGSYEVEWLEKNAHKFGFKPLLMPNPKFSDGCNRYRENWHWEFNPNFKIN
ncbi:MAG TPA: D-alanyl-D-alanine carboxypeptidase family protein, partial [Bacillota bacterium]|nr:D-alanyl-D-alanine carboxypeptidase family protein [Bacillota bacterium]